MPRHHPRRRREIYGFMDDLGTVVISGICGVVISDLGYCCLLVCKVFERKCGRECGIRRQLSSKDVLIRRVP